MSNIANSGERLRQTPVSSVMRSNTTVQNGLMTGHCHHIWNKVPTWPQSLRHSQEEVGDIWARRAGVKYHLRWILRMISRWFTHLEKRRGIKAAFSQSSAWKVVESSFSQLEIWVGVSEACAWDRIEYMVDKPLRRPVGPNKNLEKGWRSVGLRGQVIFWRACLIWRYLKNWDWGKGEDVLISLNWTRLSSSKDVLSLVHHV